jgi:tetratricopeptide (TPR) repeat protein
MRSGLADALLLLPVLAIIVWWAADDGGYDAVVWLPGTLFLVGVLGVLVVAAPWEIAVNRYTMTATILLGTFTLWSYASISWAGVRGIAWEGANRTLLYFLVFALFALRPLRPRVGFVLVAAYAVSVAVVGAVALARATNAEDAFIAGRLATPISYPNANAALFLAAAIPGIVAATRRNANPVIRALLLAAVGVLCELALLSQSRASFVALPLALLVTFALTPRRLSMLVAACLVAAPVALATHRLLAVYPAVVANHGVAGRLDDARTSVAWTAVALFAAGLVVAVVDRVVSAPERLLWAVRALAALAAGVAVAAGVVGFVRHYGDPVHEARVAWNHFKADDTDLTTARSTHLLGGVGSPRYDIWRVAVDEFTRSPVHGVGADNFAADYLKHRRTRLEPLYPHSIELRLLAQTGLVGAVLFVGFLAAALAAAVRGYRPGNRALIGACLGAVTYWLAHGSVDWLWEFPALAAPAVACLGTAAGVGGEPPSATARRPRLYPLRYVVAIPLLVAATSLALPWVAAREVDAAAAAWRAAPTQAYARLDRANRLNPLDAEASLVGGVIATQLRQPTRAADYFRSALARDPTNWFAHLQLAALASQAGRRRAALREVSRARQLNPGELTIADTMKDIRRGRPVSARELDASFIARTRVLTGTQQH